MMAAYPTLWLAQVQSFVSLGFLAVFAALSLGLAWLLAWFRLRSLGKQADPGWLAAYRFWVRVFALALVLATAGGVVVFIQLPGLWPGMPERISAVSSPLLALAIASVLLFKTCFLGPMLFAERRLAPAWHACAVLLLALGITLALACLLLLGAWMQTPAGAVLLEGQFVVQHWGQVLGNPAMPWVSGLFLAGSLLCAACAVMSVTAWQGRARALDAGQRRAFRSALGVAAVSVLALAVLSAGAGRMTAQHQPAKAAAVAAYWRSGEPVDWVLFAWPDQAQARNRAALVWHRSGNSTGSATAGAPWLGVDAQGRARGLDQFSAVHPPVAVVFLAARGAWIAGLLIALTLIYLLAFWRRTGPDGLPSRACAWLVCLGPLAGCLLLCGVATLSFGNWPFAVQDAITLDEVVTDAPAWQLAVATACAVLVYALLLAAFLGMVRHAARYGVVPVAPGRGVA